MAFATWPAALVHRLTWPPVNIELRYNIAPEAGIWLLTGWSLVRIRPGEPN
jgi:hypothetical protein